MNKNRKCLWLLFAAVTAFVTPLRAATPAGERGGPLTAAEEAQQVFLRRLRQEIAVQRILSQHSSRGLGAAESVSTVPPTIDAEFLARCSKDGVSFATLTALHVHAARPRPEGSARDMGGMMRGESCVQAVDECFRKLNSLFQRRFGESLGTDALASSTEVASAAAQGT